MSPSKNDDGLLVALREAHSKPSKHAKEHEVSPNNLHELFKGQLAILNPTWESLGGQRWGLMSTVVGVFPIPTHIHMAMGRNPVPPSEHPNPH